MLSGLTFTTNPPPKKKKKNQINLKMGEGALKPISTCKTLLMPNFKDLAQTVYLKHKHEGFFVVLLRKKCISYPLQNYIYIFIKRGGGGTFDIQGPQQ